MSKKIYAILTAILIALPAHYVGNIPVFRNVAYSLHDALALLGCNPTQMYNCGFGNSWNTFTNYFLVILICAGVFVYSNSYAYPEGLRTMSILRFGSENQYWKYAMRRNLKNVLFASTAYIILEFAFCAAFQYSRGFGEIQHVPYDHFAITYVLFWIKLMAVLSLVSMVAEVFTGRLPRAGIIGMIIVGVVLLLSIDVMQNQTALLAIGNWQRQVQAIVVFVAIQIALFAYGKVRSLKI